MKRSKKVEALKVVFDTSCYVSSILSKKSTSAEVFDLVIDRKINNFYTEEILKELIVVLLRKKFELDNYKIEEFARIVKESSYLLEQLEELKIKVCRDPKDDKFLSLAKQIQADFIISLDNDLLVLHPFGRIKILTPKDFLDFYFFK